MSKETDARINIDELLRQAGWNPADKSQVLTELTLEWIFEIFLQESASRTGRIFEVYTGLDVRYLVY